LQIHHYKGSLVHSMLETSDHLLEMKHATKALTLKNGYGRYFMLSHYYAVILLMTYGQKLGELQVQSRIKTATIIRATRQSYFERRTKRGEGRPTLICFTGTVSYDKIIHSAFLLHSDPWKYFRAT